MLYHLDFQVEYAAARFVPHLGSRGRSRSGAKKAGVVVDLWKCVGMRRVIAILDVASPDQLDQTLFDLPIRQKMGQHVHVDVAALRRYEDFAADVRDRLSAVSP
jgi:muconolactone delta-isomerase